MSLSRHGKRRERRRGSRGSVWVASSNKQLACGEASSARDGVGVQGGRRQKRDMPSKARTDDGAAAPFKTQPKCGRGRAFTEGVPLIDEETSGLQGL